LRCATLLYYHNHSIYKGEGNCDLYLLKVMALCCSWKTVIAYQGDGLQLTQC